MDARPQDFLILVLTIKHLQTQRKLDLGAQLCSSGQYFLSFMVSKSLCTFPQCPFCCYSLQEKERENGNRWSLSWARCTPGLLPAPTLDVPVQSRQRAAANCLLALRKLFLRLTGRLQLLAAPVGCHGIAWVCPSLQSLHRKKVSAMLTGGYQVMLPARMMKPSAPDNPPQGTSALPFLTKWFSLFFGLFFFFYLMAAWK